MLCVTGGETTTRQLAARLAAGRPFDMQEVRLDLLDHVDDEVLGLVGRRNVIATCRSSGERGGFRGTERERFALLTRALAHEPGYLDVELSSDRGLRQQLFGQRGTTRLVLSAHEWAAEGDGPAPSAPERLAEIGRAMSAEPADVLKIAVEMTDAAELGPLRDLLRHEGRPVVRVGMGPAGSVGRALPCRLGSAWTYVRADDAAATAPGQLTMSQALAWRIDQSAQLVPLGLLGGPQVLRSPGPAVYNRLFAELGAPFLYLPVVTSRPLETLALLEGLGFAGLSVTMPAKEALLGQLDELDVLASRVGAVNTVRLRDGRRFGLNTDVGAVWELLSAHAGARALVLGAGGAARAAVVALRDLGCSVTVAGRSASRTSALAQALSVTAVSWDGRAREPFDVLVNATPCGGDGASDPMPFTAPLTNCAVLDLVLAPDTTPLLKRVAQGGGEAIRGIEMWLLQGARQVSALTGLRVRPDDLRRYLPAPPTQSESSKREEPGSAPDLRDGARP